MADCNRISWLNSFQIFFQICDVVVSVNESEIFFLQLAVAEQNTEKKNHVTKIKKRLLLVRAV